MPVSEQKPDAEIETPTAKTAPQDEAKASGDLDAQQLDKATAGGWPPVYVYAGGAGSGPI
jgi:hypothetical protein